MSTKTTTWQSLQQRDCKAANHVNRRIDFHLARKPQNGFQSHVEQSAQSQKRANGQDSEHSAAKRQRGEQGLFDAQVVDRNLSWQRIRRVGPGLFNLGNTCFLNSSLQCLLYTPSLAQVLMSDVRLGVSPSGHHSTGDAQPRSILQLFQRYVSLLAQ
jgi:hypothetical protein